MENTTSTFTGEPKWYSNASDKDYTRLRIEKQEKKDAYIVTRMLEDNLKKNKHSHRQQWEHIMISLPLYL